MLDQLEGHSVPQIWCECRQRVVDTAKPKNFLNKLIYTGFSLKVVREVENHSEGGPFSFDVVHITTKNADVPLMWSWNTTLTNFLGENPVNILGEIRTLILKNQCVREIVPFPRASHILFI